MKLIIKRRPPNISKYSPDTPPPDAQVHVCKRTINAVINLIKKTVHDVNIGQPKALKINIDSVT